jgi:hypothetical protein
MSIIARIFLILTVCSVILVTGCKPSSNEKNDTDHTNAKGFNGSCAQTGCHSKIETMSESHDCVSCHGGDSEALTKKGAHPQYTPVINDWFAAEFPMRNKGWNSTGVFDESFAKNGLAEIRFINPGDLHVADQTCGAEGCHGNIVRRVKLNIHAGMQGDLSQVLYLNNDPLQPDKNSRFGGAGHTVNTNTIAAAEALAQSEAAASGISDVHPGVNIPAYSAEQGTVLELNTLPPIDCIKSDDSRIAASLITTQACPNVENDCCPTGYSYVGAPQTGPGQMTEGEVVSRMYDNNDCARCHLWNDGSKRIGDMRGSGCSACHVKYANDGMSRSADESIDKSILSRPAKHTHKGSTDDDQCAHCHNRGGRIPQAYYGRREKASGGVTSPFNPPNASYTDLSILGEGPYSNLHGRNFPYYVDDENTANEYDETPPDVHTKYGMQCVDCHIETEVHGDGHIYADRFYEVEIKCETCHGTITEIANGDTLKYVDAAKTTHRKHSRISVNNGQVTLRLKSNDQVIPVTQTKTAFDLRNQKSSRAHTTRHMDTMECFTCHSTWYPNCFACHVERDDSAPERNWVDGKVRVGKLTKDNRKYVSVDTFVMGVNRNDDYQAEGKFAPFIGFGTFNSYKDGIKLVYKDRVPKATDGSSVGIPWNKIHPHTNQLIARNCDECHRTPSMAENKTILMDVDCDDQEGDDYQATCQQYDRLRVTYGLGSRRYRQDAFIPNPDPLLEDIQVEYVLDRFVGEDRYTINCPDQNDTADPACLGRNPTSHDGFRALTDEEVDAMFAVEVANDPRGDPKFPNKPALGVLK